MSSGILKAARSLVGIIVGYIVIVVGTVLAFEVFLGGIGYYKSTLLVLTIASVAAFITGLAGGFVGAWLGGKPYLLQAGGVLLLLTLDTTFVITSGVSNDPLWFDLIGALTLMTSALMGGFLKDKISKKETILVA
jgi:hypothetical protein